MSIARGALRDLIRDYADAASAARWTDAVLNQWADLAHQLEWSRILNANPYTRVGVRTVTTSDAGLLSGASLTAGSGDTAEVWYRVLTMTTAANAPDGALVLRPLTQQEVPLALSTVWPPEDYAYYQIGDDFQVLPATALPLTVTVNHRPTRVTALSSDAALVVCPEGFEPVIALEAAALALAKGGAETGSTADLRALAEQVRAPLLDDLARRTARPMTLRFPDRRAEWAG